MSAFENDWSAASFDESVVSIEETVAAAASVFESDEPVVSVDESDEAMPLADNTLEPIASVWTDSERIDSSDSAGGSEVAEPADDQHDESTGTRKVVDDDITRVLAPDVAAAWALY